MSLEAELQALREEIDLVLAHPDLLIGIGVSAFMLILLLSIGLSTIDIRRF